MAWDDEKKEAVVEAYKEANPTPETSIEIVKEIARHRAFLFSVIAPGEPDAVILWAIQ